MAWCGFLSEFRRDCFNTNPTRQRGRPSLTRRVGASGFETVSYNGHEEFALHPTLVHNLSLQCSGSPNTIILSIDCTSNVDARSI